MGDSVFLRSVFWQTIAVGLSMLRGMLQLAVISRLGTEGYAIFSQMWVTMTLFAPILTLHLDAAVVREISGATIIRQSQPGDIISTAMAMTLMMLAFIVMIWAFQGGAVSVIVLGDIGYAGYVPPLAAMMVPFTLNIISLSYIQAFRYFRTTAILQISDNLCQLIGITAAVMSGCGGMLRRRSATI